MSLHTSSLYRALHVGAMSASLASSSPPSCSRSPIRFTPFLISAGHWYVAPVSLWKIAVFHRGSCKEKKMCVWVGGGCYYRGKPIM